jgi:hypothetical protein
LSSGDHVWKIRDRKKRKDSGKYSFVYKTITHLKYLNAESIGTFPFTPTNFRKKIRRTIISGEGKLIER